MIELEATAVLRSRRYEVCKTSAPTENPPQTCSLGRFASLCGSPCHRCLLQHSRVRRLVAHHCLYWPDADLVGYGTLGTALPCCTGHQLRGNRPVGGPNRVDRGCSSSRCFWLIQSTLSAGAIRGLFFFGQEG